MTAMITYYLGYYRALTAVGHYSMLCNGSVLKTDIVAACKGQGEQIQATQ